MEASPSSEIFKKLFLAGLPKSQNYELAPQLP